MKDDGGPEDVEMGHCLKNVGVHNEDSRDNYGRFRFLPFPVKSHVKFGQILKNGEKLFLDYADGVEQSRILVLESKNIE